MSTGRPRLIMMTFFTPERCGRVPVGAVLLLVAWAFCAPRAARAGCSGLVTSRTDRHLLASFLPGETFDPGDATPSPFHSRPMPRAPSPCRGVWCDDGPTVPALPAGTEALRAPLWAWYPSIPGQVPMTPARVIAEGGDSHPLDRAIAIFRPPRRPSLA